MSILSKKYFHNEEAAYVKLESIVWPDGPVCPHCGAMERISKIQGKTARTGLRFCGHCRKQFTVKIGTVLESSHVPVYKWLQAMYLIASSKKGISAHQLHRTLEVTYKTAWFMHHRIREAMKPAYLDTFGGEGKIVEVDETFIGTEKEKSPTAHGYQHKMKVVTLVERGGRARSMVVDHVL